MNQPTTTVLVADDSLVVRTVVRAHLEQAGYRVLEAFDGAAALDACRRQLPDVVLLDIEMPHRDGHEVLIELKADEQLRDVPVVFLTGRTTTDDVLAGLRAGAHDYLKKPFDSAELVARVASAAHVKKLQDSLRERNDELERLTRTDTLTGMYNRRHLEEELARALRTARRTAHDVSVILLDIDHFKRINDTYGHAAGDRVLCEFADRLRAQLRAGDIAARWGGEEFLVVLPNTDLPGAINTAERIRAALADPPIDVAGQYLTVTVSGGCVADGTATPDALISSADERLYRAKAAGRNQIIAAPRTVQLIR